MNTRNTNTQKKFLILLLLSRANIVLASADVLPFANVAFAYRFLRAITIPFKWDRNNGGITKEINEELILQLRYGVADPQEELTEMTLWCNLLDGGARSIWV
jgi:hypothetical protein